MPSMQITGALPGQVPAHESTIHLMHRVSYRNALCRCKTIALERTTYTSRSRNSQGGAPTARTTITEYVNPLRPDHQRPDTILPPYTLRARVRIPSGGERQLAGVVFDYEDEANFREAVFSPSGTWELRKVRFGVSTSFASGGYSGGGQNVWFDVEIRHDFFIVTVRINGNLLASVNMVTRRLSADGWASRRMRRSRGSTRSRSPCGVAGTLNRPRQGSHSPSGTISMALAIFCPGSCPAIGLIPAGNGRWSTVRSPTPQCRRPAPSCTNPSASPSSRSRL